MKKRDKKPTHGHHYDTRTRFWLILDKFVTRGWVVALLMPAQNNFYISDGSCISSNVQIRVHCGTKTTEGHTNTIPHTKNRGDTCFQLMRFTRYYSALPSAPFRYSPPVRLCKPPLHRYYRSILFPIHLSYARMCRFRRSTPLETRFGRRAETHPTITLWLLTASP